jgi:hypothetical protein
VYDGPLLQSNSFSTLQHESNVTRSESSGTYRRVVPDDGGSRHLLKVGLLQRDYTVLYPRRLSSSYSTP